MAYAKKALSDAVFYTLQGGPMKNKMTKLLKNQKGQGVMEYVIISSLVGIFCLVAVKEFGEVIKTRVNSMKQEIVKNIELKS